MSANERVRKRAKNLAGKCPPPLAGDAEGAGVAAPLAAVSVLAFLRLRFSAIEYAKFRSRSHDAVIRVYDEAGNVIETHEDKGDFKEP
jgi:hypothetical protein